MSCSRRQFLTTCLSGSLMLSSGPLLAGCTATRTHALRKLPLPGKLDSLTARLLHYASLAPSGHNSQPWEVTILSPTQWRVGIPPDRFLPAVDPQGRESLISLGAFVENCAQAAAVEGLAIESEVTGQDPPGRVSLELKLVPGQRAPDTCLQRMEQRRVVKKGQRPEVLTATDARWLEGLWPGQVEYHARGTNGARWLAEGTIAAMAAQCQREEAMVELSRWVRFGAKMVGTNRDGLTSAGMEINGLAGWLVDHFYAAEDVLKDSFRRQTVDMTARLAGEGAGWVLLRGPGSTAVDLIAASRQFERLFLQLRERNIACHPMSQMLEEADGLRDLHSRFGAGKTLQMLLRVGYVDNYPEPVSPRRPPEWFTFAAQG